MEYREEENVETVNPSFDTLDSIMKVGADLKKRIKVDPYKGVNFKEGMIFQKPELSESPLLHPDVMMGNLMMAQNKSPQEIEMIIGNNMEIALNNIVMSCNGIDYSGVFLIPNVLAALRNIFSRTPQVMLNTVFNANKLIYDTMARQDDYPAKEQVLEGCRNLATEVNKKTINELLQINSYGHSKHSITPRLAMYLAVSRYSSFDDSTNIARLNFVIMTQSLEVFNEQIIVDIYGVLFSRLGVLFNSIMFNVYDEEDHTWFTEEHSTSCSLQVNAVLDIMNTQTFQVIGRVLSDYVTEFTQVYGGNINAVRSSLRGLSTDYDVINKVIAAMEAQGIYVP